MEGRQVGNFRIVSKLGEGGMGVVYLAEHPRIGRKAAIKFVKPDQRDKIQSIERFATEAWAANSIRHPNIVEIFDFGTLPEGDVYIVMEYLEGETLAARLKREARLPVPLALQLTWQSANGLHAAHAKGIIHRDLKPDNLFLVPDRRAGGHHRVKIVDFGIAKLMNPLRVSSMHTRTGTVLGTPVYASPEQLRGRQIDNRSDIYALGLILYEMVCGRPPFVSEALGDLVNMHLGVTPGSPRAVNPAVSEHLERIIYTALRKRPEKRFSDMSAFAEALTMDTAWAAPMELASHPTPSQTPGPVPLLLEEVNRKAAATAAHRRGVRWLLAAGVAGAALTAGLLVSPRVHRSAGERGSPTGRAVTDPPARHNPAPSADEAGSAYLDEAEAFAASGRFTSALSMLDKARALEIRTPALNIRLVSVADAIETKLLIARAQRLFEVGQTDAAVEAAKAALDRDSSNGAAIAVLTAIRNKRDESRRPAATASRGATPARAATGKGFISVTSVPAGSVYLNDAPVGRAPITKRLVPAGRHVVEVRAQGYRPSRREITLPPRRSVSLSMALVAEPPEHARRPPAPLPDPPPLPNAAPAATEGPARPTAPVSPAPASAPAANTAVGAKPFAAGKVYSVAPTKNVPIPSLPRTRSGAPRDLEAVLRQVEAQAVSLAGVSPEFAGGLTLPLLNALGDRSEATIYPAALYYLVVREAALVHDKATAARNLKEAHFGGGLRALLDLPTESP